MRTMLRSILFLSLIGAAGTCVAAAQQALPATDVKAADIEATLRDEIVAFRPVVDMPIRTVDAGGHNIGVGLVYRLAPGQGGSASHDKVSEVYYILEGGGTYTTGGSMPDPKNRTAGIKGGVTNEIKPGDIIVIPPGTAHWFSKINGHVTYIEARFPGNVLAPPAR